jgi:hypothetical protein
LATGSLCREVGQTWSFRGSKSRNKVTVGEPAVGSLTKNWKAFTLLGWKPFKNTNCELVLLFLFCGFIMSLVFTLVYDSPEKTFIKQRIIPF